jgi:hypothetical protein
MSVDHPSLWRFINSIRQIQSSRDADYERCIAGYEPDKKRRKYRDADNRIKHVVNGFTIDNVVVFLRGVAHNFLME